MAKGFKAVEAAQEDISARKNAGGDFPKRKYFRLADGEAAVVRFLEEGEEVSSAWTHQTAPTGNRKFGPYVPCRNQDPVTGEPNGEDCPGCEDGLKKKFRGYINLIWRDAPVYGEDKDGKVDYNKVVGNEDQVVLWETGIEVFEDLQIADTDFKGLSSRDFKVRRRGERLDTKYSISPADPDGGAKNLSKSDALLSTEKYDLDELTDPAPYDRWGKFGGDKPESTTAVDTDARPFRKRLEARD